VKLSDTKIKSAKPRDKKYKMLDGEGLFLVVAPNGSKYWRLRYYDKGKEKEVALGIYPALPLSDARKEKDKFRALIKNGIDPITHKQTQKDDQRRANENSFEVIAREWHGKNFHTWTPDHAETIMSRLERDIFPWLGHKPITAITPPEMLATLRRIESRGALDTAHRIHQICGKVFRYAVATGRAERDPCADVKGALPPTRQKHLASIIDPVEVGKLLLAIEGYKGTLIARCALQIAPYLFCRPGELRHMEWKEIDFENAEWRIPAHKMKMRTMHIVPLSQQALKILNEIKPATSHSIYVFPSIRSNQKPMSENTVLAGLRRLGYTTEEMTGHGFRSMASTLLNELGWNPDAIERQLAHGERNSVRAAYNYAEYLPERRKMMQAWADHLDKLKNEAKNKK